MDNTIANMTARFQSEANAETLVNQTLEVLTRNGAKCRVQAKINTDVRKEKTTPTPWPHQKGNAPGPVQGPGLEDPIKSNAPGKHPTILDSKLLPHPPQDNQQLLLVNLRLEGSPLPQT